MPFHVDFKHFQTSLLHQNGWCGEISHKAFLMNESFSSIRAAVKHYQPLEFQNFLLNKPTVRVITSRKLTHGM